MLGPDSVESRSTPGGAFDAVAAELYELLSGSRPILRRVDSDGIPEPYRRALVHRESMTATLERLCGSGVELVVMLRKLRRDVYTRCGLLCARPRHEPLLFCALSFSRGRLSSSLWRSIIEERAPLGRLLREQGIEIRHRPDGFFLLLADPFMERMLRLQDEKTLWGRFNSLVDADEEPVFSTIEVCAPRLGRCLVDTAERMEPSW